MSWQNEDDFSNYLQIGPLQLQLKAVSDCGTILVLVRLTVTIGCLLGVWCWYTISPSVPASFLIVSEYVDQSSSGSYPPVQGATQCWSLIRNNAPYMIQHIAQRHTSWWGNVDNNVKLKTVMSMPDETGTPPGGWGPGGALRGWWPWQEYGGRS